MTIQPDGTVLPCQSWPETVGHILDNSWLEIWEHPTCREVEDPGVREGYSCLPKL